MHAVLCLLINKTRKQFGRQRGSILRKHTTNTFQLVLMNFRILTSQACQCFLLKFIKKILKKKDCLRVYHHCEEPLKAWLMHAHFIHSPRGKSQLPLGTNWNKNEVSGFDYMAENHWRQNKWSQHSVVMNSIWHWGLMTRNAVCYINLLLLKYW